MAMLEMIKVGLEFPNEKIADIEREVENEINKICINIKPKGTIAIAAGSRGISNIDVIIKTIIKTLIDRQFKPFIFPAMGSHGGANAKGQTEVLESFGITKETMGVPIKSCMDVVQLDSDGLDIDVFMDKHAYNADGIIAINRIKAHTDFTAETESGLLKMLVIGIGKHKQALAVHQRGIYGLSVMIPQIAKRVLGSGKIIMGLGIVENAYDETMIIKAIAPESFEAEEKELLKISKRNMPSLPVNELDILIIDQMGKDVSGSGMDTKIIGRRYIKNEEEFESPQIGKIIVSDITDGSHGNAIGIGLADFTTKRLFDKLDLDATYENVLTSTFVERGKIPIITANDKQAYEYALRVSAAVDSSTLKVMRIKNTLNLSEMYVSKAVYDLISCKHGIETLSEFIDMFGDDNNSIDF